MSGCVFCGIVAGAEPATIVREWPDAVAFAPHGPVIKGHTLVVPRRHVDHATEDPTVTAATMARAAEFAAQWPSSNIQTSVGRPAKQSVFHLHIHVIPRVEGDQLMVPWGTTGDPHEPHWCRIADDLQRKVDDRYPRRCSQCGQRWGDRACGPTHALISHELGIADLRAAYAELMRAADDLLRLKDGPRDDAYRAAKDDAWARARSLRDKYLNPTGRQS